MIYEKVDLFSERIMPKIKMSIDFQMALAKPGRH
jgi:hypothetical protein